jgi:hypothetical protein
MGLVLTGKLFSRESTPYDMSATGGPTGVSHKARVGYGRGEYLDVKLPDSALEIVPETSHIPEDGMPVSWECRFKNSKVEFVALSEPAKHAATPLRAATS